MEPFNSKTKRIGSSIYVLVPSSIATENNINEEEHYQVELKRLVPETEGAQNA